MVKLLIGHKGSGKTNQMVQLANDCIEKGAGSIIFINKNHRLMYELNYKIRVICMEDFEHITNIDEYIGFLYGIISSDHDIDTIFIDSITRLARAYNLTVPPSGRTLSGGLDPAALYMPKRFFGAARNMREGGSLTILATALVDTGSKMDDVVYEEFKGTGNMELVLDRKLQERRVFPAIDIAKSGTRREDLLLTPDEQEAVYNMRKALNGMKSEEAVENILNMFARTRNNSELIQILKKQKIV